jgi:hypothetical protein
MDAATHVDHDPLSALAAQVAALLRPPVNVDRHPRIQEGIERVAVVLTSASWPDATQVAASIGADLRDLNEHEVAYLEHVKVATVQGWRRNGTGPKYRNEAGIVYPVAELWAWRKKGLQSSTAQGVRRGRRA